MTSTRTNKSTRTTEPTRITATQLARSLSDVLNRVRYQGERFEIQRNGETVATLTPTEAPAKGGSLREYLKAIERGPRMDPDFLDELEQINANQPPPQVREWPD
jgi:antitoxin (DNA-binding transcriptional repressor) of toxin-antitoxin stability system